MALHLAEASYACPVLTDDKSARQKVLEDSIYKVTMDCWKHKVKKFEKLGLGSSRPRYMYLQACMYKFMEKLDKQDHLTAKTTGSRGEGDFVWRGTDDTIQ